MSTGISRQSAASNGEMVGIGEPTLAGLSIVPLMRPVESFVCFGLDGTKCKVTNDEQIFTGSVRILARVHEGLVIDGAFFAFGRNASCRVSGEIGGRLELTVPPETLLALRRRGQVAVEIDAVVAENFIFCDGATGHGSITIKVLGQVGGSIEILASGETGISTHVDVEIRGHTAEDVVVRGLPFKVEERAEGIVVLISSDLDPALARRLTQEQDGHQVLRYGHG